MVTRLVVIIDDDVGRDWLPFLDDETIFDRIAAYQPNLTALRAESVMLRNHRTQPFCAPCRANSLTGQYARRHGLGAGFARAGGSQPHPFLTPLSFEMMTYFERIRGIPSMHAGKWHVTEASEAWLGAGNALGQSNTLGAAGIQWGPDHFYGSVHNLRGHLKGESYSSWPIVIDGVESTSTEWHSTAIVSAYIAWAAAQTDYLAVVAFNAPHGPWEAPPGSALMPQYPVVGEDSVEPYFREMLEQRDVEIGRILAQAATDGAYVIYFSDNGTPDSEVPPPGTLLVSPFVEGRGKGQLYDQAIRNPLLIKGPGIVSPGRTSLALAHATDLHATICDLFGRSTSAEDSASYLPVLFDAEWAGVRQYSFSDYFAVNGAPYTDGWRQCAVGKRFKLIREQGQPDELYDLALDPLELDNKAESPRYASTLQCLADVCDSAGEDGGVL